ECEGARGIRRIQNIESLAPDIRAEFECVPASNRSEGIEKLRNRCSEIRICGRRRTDLLEPRNGEDRQDGTERVCRKPRNADSTILQGSLIQIAAGIPDAKLIESRRRDRPAVVSDKSISARDGMPDDARRQAAAAIGKRRDRCIVVAKPG